MTATGAHSPKPPPSTEWIFCWRTFSAPLLPKFLALTFASIVFALLITSVRVQLVQPEKVSPRKASLIYLGDDAQSRALALRAQEGGPFPSRFDPSDWQGLAETERLAMNAASYQPPAYQPVLNDLPEENLVPPLVLAPHGKAFFPERPAVAPPMAESPVIADHTLVPRLYPLSDDAAAVIPKSLPAFTAPVDAVMTSANWRFLICLSPAGTVTQCVSLEKGGETAADALVAWLRQIPFSPAAEYQERWISLAIAFAHPSDHGTDAR